MRFVCPACGYDGLFDPPWRDGSPSDDICPSCGIQFGYHDAAGGDATGRELIYTKWRQRWIDAGMPWHSAAVESPPAGWDPEAQLKALAER